MPKAVLKQHSLPTHKANTSQPAATSPVPTPAFGQPQPSSDETSFKTPHPSDNSLYDKVNTRLVEPFPAPRGGTEPVITLAGVWGPQLGPGKAAAIQAAKQIVFCSAGDTGTMEVMASTVFARSRIRPFACLTLSMTR
jgi:hypothetical protein